jgi:hypothetical protein
MSICIIRSRNSSVPNMRFDTRETTLKAAMAAAGFGPWVQIEYPDEIDPHFVGTDVILGTAPTPIRKSGSQIRTR